MEEISLEENYINKIPDWLLELPNLKVLQLAINDLEDNPTTLAKANNLEVLSIDALVKKPIHSMLGSLSKSRNPRPLPR